MENKNNSQVQEQVVYVEETKKSKLLSALTFVGQCAVAAVIGLAIREGFDRLTKD